MEPWLENISFKFEKILKNIHAVELSHRVTAQTYPNGPDAGREAGRLGIRIRSIEKKVKFEMLPCCIKFHEPHVVLECTHF